MSVRRKVSIDKPCESNAGKKPVLETKHTEVEINFDLLSVDEIINTILERSSDPVKNQAVFTLKSRMKSKESELRRKKSRMKSKKRIEEEERSQGRSRDDVILLVSDELDGMSKKRILRVLQGEDALSSSSSSEVSEEDEERSVEASMHSDSESTSSSGRSEVDGSESERASFSDIELIEGLDVDSNNLPDVSGT
ncbi:hypothetical protein ANCCAN_16896 [Ancylostoma caninum]|uniref:Uncharacterized protein n=1 Tax=Ancylostoma caninum TaxID=29170 RepID=A0A368G2K3_ANCCA|nr:hypothetical protein ANCCAN_16896 [Ancylostoma caninum]